MYFTIKDSNGVTLSHLNNLMTLMETDVKLFKDNVITIYKDADYDNDAKIIGTITFENLLLWSLSYKNDNCYTNVSFEGKEMLKKQVIDTLMKLEVMNND